MKWRKLGRVFVPSGEHWWARHYAHLPTVDVLEDRLRVYFAGLDDRMYGRIGYVDVATDDPTRVLAVADEPVLDIGDLGTFDDCGVVPSDIMMVGEKKFLYYIGFQRAERVPYMLFTGLATKSPDDQNFVRHSRVPILDRTDSEPFSRSAPCLLYDAGIYKMWYWSCTQWTDEGEKTHYNNVIRYATSNDGIHWHADDHICIEPNFRNEYSVGRPAILKKGHSWHMYYAIRAHSSPYRMGYAVSSDGIHWDRKDELANISASASGWDSAMICYPHIVQVNGSIFMFYNGNQHGKSGFGCAVLEYE